MPFNEFREYLDHLKANGLYNDCDAPLNVERGNMDMQPLMRHLHDTEGPALKLTNLQNYNRPDVPVVFNAFGSRERTVMTFGETDPLVGKMKLAGILGNKESWHAPRMVDAANAPVKAHTITEDEVDLSKQVPHVWFGKEGPSYVTSAVTVSKDPETGERNVGWYRYAQLWNASHPLGGEYSDFHQKRCMPLFAWWNPPMNHVGLHYSKAKAMGKPLEVAIAVLCEPAVHMAAGTGLAYGEDEYEFAGGLKGGPVDLVKCDTVDLEVPASAEWVMEGVILEAGEEAIGWHSNPGGYYDMVNVFPLFQVNHITHRKDPLWYNTMEMVPPFDHNYLALLPVEGEVLADLQRKCPEVQDVVVTPNMHFIVQLNVDGADKPHPEFGKYILHAVWGSAGRWGRTAKWITVVGPDVDPYDPASVEWAVMTRVQPWSDTIINKSGQAYILDVSAPKGEQFAPTVSEQIGIDATIKIPERFKEYPPHSNAEPEDVARIAELLARHR